MVKASRAICQRLLACWGNGDYGRLGHGVECWGETIPRVCGSLSDVTVTQAACGGAHTVVATDAGTVFSMGLNEDGQLGHSQHSRYVPVPQEALIPEAVSQVVSGHHHTLFLTASGDVWACGRNTRGQLGLGSKAGPRIAVPQQVEALKGANIVKLATGAEHSLAVSAAGELFSWGSGSNGRLGHAQSSNRLWFWNKDQATPKLVQCMTEKVHSASCGHMHSGCIDVSGAAYTWGYGSFWQLGTGSTADVGLPQQVSEVHGVAALAMGGAHTLALRYTDDVVAWGANQNGVLGLGMGVSRDAKEPEKVPKLSCSRVATGWKHSAAIGHAGQLLCWGWGGSVGTATSFETGRSSGGQLGLGNEFDYWAPTEVTDLQLVTAETFPEAANADALFTSWKALQVSCGFNHTAAVVETSQA